jgi:hypothetical protein
VLVPRLGQGRETHLDVVSHSSPRRRGRQQEVIISESPLSRYAGPIAVIAGGLFAVAHVGMFFVADRSDLVAMMTDPVFLVFNAAYAITFPLSRRSGSG